MMRNGGRAAWCVLLFCAACAFGPARARAAEGDGASASGEPGGTGVQFSLTGRHRVRYEALDPQFRVQPDTHDQVFDLRTDVLLGAHWSHVGVVAELMDSRGELNDAGSTVSTSVADTVEPLQAYVDWTGRFSATGAENTFRAGRITLDVGKRRLIARNRFRNTSNSFLGFDWTRKGPQGRTLQAFYLRPMRILPNDKSALLDNEQRFDRSDPHTDLWGAFYGFPSARSRDRVELYAVQLTADEKSDRRDLTTVGTRVYRSSSPGKWHYAVEAMWQTGTSTGTVAGVSRSGLDHDAYFAHVEFGYAFTAPGKPDLMFQYDTATGDRDPNDDRDQRFDTLYGSRRADFGPTGIYGPFARANLDTPGLRLGFVPAKRWKGMAAYRTYHLQSDRDAWTTTNLRDPSGQSGDSLGWQAETQFQWNGVKNRLGVEAGYAYFSKGSFVKRTAPNQSSPSNYFYTALTVSF
ncbi:MAG TPA: alginate export family protein [Gammaproteobacteria bacterium]|nr:alginate export family protein [Gammaproteobacteria bacterium]